MGALHHVEVWVPDLAAAVRGWGWLLGELGWTPFQEWPAGRSWRLGPTYLVLERSPALRGARHDRLAPGLNHLAFHAGPPAAVDHLVEAAPAHGWTLLFADRHPHAGGPQTYAAYLTDNQGYEVELVASPPG
ncbi:VOC family protein [Micromonospora sp. NPDC047465]|uniref:VOC family protein n=1 Tax=Micromonospora sp. NPDC047465 TaxID=3154813 RepID=UPI0033FD9475